MIFSGLVRSIRRCLRFLLEKPVTWIAEKVSSAPDRSAVLTALSELYLESKKQSSRKIKHIDLREEQPPIIIFSDEHRGTRNGSDDFGVCEPCYLAAMAFYNREKYSFINLGDCEELWENTMFGIAKHNDAVYAAEKLFINRNAYFKVFGNHDLFWANDPFASLWLKKIYGKAIRVYAAILIRYKINDDCLDIFCTHGHQGDKQSDGNAFSKWFVSYIWGPLQNFLEININSTSANDNLKTLHNMYMYDWSAAQEKTILITGHTHQPVFNSLTHLERLYQRLEKAKTLDDTDELQKIQQEIPRRKREYDFVNHSFNSMQPSYFNSGCCCFDDGTITGIEISQSTIRLIKWSLVNGQPVRRIEEEEAITSLFSRLKSQVVA